MREIWVDFNSVDAHGLATTLAAFAEDGVMLSIGQQVLAGDDDGHLCEASIVDMGSDGSVTLAVDLGKFRQSQRHVRVAV
ncbi:hypothetical protein [Aeromicrobium sp. Root472D3]|uniref:hypothetical protein n=1 Tax=Aeromicrobium sp. Root472D3 TaxID=1736540 RepID=UPI0012F8C11D|nr:hypothetical protein [Aeromicrobium sp. Root472D3]